MLLQFSIRGIDGEKNCKIILYFFLLFFGGRIVVEDIYLILVTSFILLFVNFVSASLRCT